MLYQFCKDCPLEPPQSRAHQSSNPPHTLRNKWIYTCSSASWNGILPAARSHSVHLNWLLRINHGRITDRASGAGAPGPMAPGGPGGAQQQCRCRCRCRLRYQRPLFFRIFFSCTSLVYVIWHKYRENRERRVNWNGRGGSGSSQRALGHRT